MRLRMAFLVPVLVLSGLLTACGGDDAEPSSNATPNTRLSPTAPSAPLTEATISCARFEATAKRIAEAQSELYSASGAKAAIDELVTELDALKDGAPANVQKALDDLGDAFRTAAEVLENPTQENAEKLQDLGTELAESGQLVSEYIVSKCS